MNFNAKLAGFTKKWEEAHSLIVTKQKEQIKILCDKKIAGAFEKITGKDSDQREFTINFYDTDVDSENPLQAETIEYLQELGFTSGPVKGLNKTSWFKRVSW